MLRWCVDGRQGHVLAKVMLTSLAPSMHMLGEEVRLPLCHATEIEKMSAALEHVRFELHRKGVRLEDLLSS